MEDSQLPPTRERTGALQRGSDSLRGSRDLTADTDNLGRPPGQAGRAARKTYSNVPPPSPEFDRFQPGLENRCPDAPSAALERNSNAAENKNTTITV